MRNVVRGTIYKKSIFRVFEGAKNLGLLLAPIFLLLNTVRISLYKLIHSRTPIVKEAEKELKKKFSEYYNNYWNPKNLLLDDYYKNISESYNISPIFPEEDYFLYFQRPNRKGLESYIRDKVFLEICYETFLSKKTCLEEKDKLNVNILSADSDFYDIYNFAPGRFYELFIVFNSGGSSYVQRVLSLDKFYVRTKNFLEDKFPFYKISGFYVN